MLLNILAFLCLAKANRDAETTSLNKCAEGTHKCHASATCIVYEETDSPASYQCECDDVFVNDIVVLANETFIDKGDKCTYTLPDSDDVGVGIFTYDGKATFYHYIEEYNYDYDYYYQDPYAHNFGEAVDYCNKLGMHLPVPNTLQQYEDLKKIPRNGIDDRIWLGYIQSPSLDAWINLYNDEELAIMDIPMNDSYYYLEMTQYGSFDWNAVSGYDAVSRHYRATLCVQVRMLAEHNCRCCFEIIKLTVAPYWWDSKLISKKTKIFEFHQSFETS